MPPTDNGFVDRAKTVPVLDMVVQTQDVRRHNNDNNEQPKVNEKT
jgi:hypothetical protein